MYIPAPDLKECEVCSKVKFKIGVPVYPEDPEESPRVCSAKCVIRGKRIWTKREEPNEVEELAEEIAKFGETTLPVYNQFPVLQTSLIGW